MRAALGPIKIGVAGLGAIGRQVCRAMLTPDCRAWRSPARPHATRDRAESFLATLQVAPRLPGCRRLVEASDLVVEASTQAAILPSSPR